MLIKHVRDWDGKPVATIVSTAKDEFGVAICSSKDTFNKKMGVKIAEGRAVMHAKLPNSTRRVYYWGSNGKTPINDFVDKELESMRARAERYFQNAY